MSEPLRAHWDFDDLDATETRFRALLAGTAGPARADVLTQLARIEGLHGRFEEGDRLLDEAEDLAGPSARAVLERGRLRRSSGDVEAALPLFEASFDLAREAGERFLAADAAHMSAIAAPDRHAMRAWTERGLALASGEAAYWQGPLLNNLGWAHYEAGAYEEALTAFEGALAARERDPERPGEREIARYAVAKALRALGRAGEAAALLEQAIAWTQSVGKPDPWFHEELAQAYEASGRIDEGREQSALAARLRSSGDAV